MSKGERVFVCSARKLFGIKARNAKFINIYRTFTFCYKVCDYFTRYRGLMQLRFRIDPWRRISLLRRAQAGFEYVCDFSGNKIFRKRK